MSEMEIKAAERSYLSVILSVCVFSGVDQRCPDTPRRALLVH